MGEKALIKSDVYNTHELWHQITQCIFVKLAGDRFTMDTFSIFIFSTINKNNRYVSFRYSNEKLSEKMLI
jgi:hypothetical protein